jgi:hypothetical protein
MMLGSTLSLGKMTRASSIRLFRARSRIELYIVIYIFHFLLFQSLVAIPIIISHSNHIYHFVILLPFLLLLLPFVLLLLSFWLFLNCLIYHCFIAFLIYHNKSFFNNIN